MDQFFVKKTVAVHDLSNIVLYVTFAQAFSNPPCRIRWTFYVNMYNISLFGRNVQVQNAERIVKLGNDSEQPEALAAEGVGKRKAVTGRFWNGYKYAKK